MQAYENNLYVCQCVGKFKITKEKLHASIFQGICQSFKKKLFKKCSRWLVYLQASENPILQ